MSFATRLLFLPGAGADPDFWRPIGNRLPTQWGKVYFGWPGLGHQPRHPDVNGLEDLLRLVETAMDDGPVDLLAQSMGGLVAMLLALRHPARIRRLVLSVTSAGVPTARLGGAEWWETYHGNYPDAATWIREIQVDLSAQLPRVTQPVLLLWGDRDPISPVSVGAYLRDLLPNARLHVVSGGDHDLVHARPDEVARSVGRHLGAPSVDEPIRMRRAVPADAAAIGRLTREAYAKWIELNRREPTPMTVDYDEAVRRNRFDLLFLGDVFAGLIETDDGSDQLLIVNVAVAPGFQGRGLGTRLMAFAEEIARSLGRRRIGLYTNQRWRENVRLYLKLGYRIDSEQAIDNGRVRVNMSKELDR